MSLRDRFVTATLAAIMAAGCKADLPETVDSFAPEAPGSCSERCGRGGDIGRLPALPSATLATRFAPYEPALAFDLTLIDTVVRARQADPQQYSEGANPYAIRYAVYNLRNEQIAEALADAEAAGVDVQVLIEADQLDPARDWNTTDELLISRGFELAGDHRALDDDGRASADLVGITGSGLMHLKARLYRWRDAVGADHRRVVTGSMNPGDMASQNDETLHLIDDPAIADAFDGTYQAVLAGRPIDNQWRPGAAINVLFCPAYGVQARDRIAALIDAEQELILIAVYSLRNVAPSTGGPGILERLVAAHQRGVAVAVITDRKQSDGVDSDGNQIYWNDGSEEILRDGGVPLFEVINRSSPFNAMHTKYGIFGASRPVVVTDAGNWSRAGLGSGSRPPSNHESVLFIDTMALDGGVTGRRYLGNFVEILYRYDGQDGAAEPLFQRLAGLPGWPAVDISIAARAETVWGQQLALTGDLPELGHWLQDYAGAWPLLTDGASYPVWTGEPLVLPLGQRAQYKLIKRAQGAVEWENGDNRRLIADPTDGRMIGDREPARALTVDLAWR